MSAATAQRAVTSFRVDPVLWEDFRELCGEHKVSQTEALEEMIRGALAAHRKDPALPATSYEREMVVGLLRYLRNPKATLKEAMMPLLEKLFRVHL